MLPRPVVPHQDHVNELYRAVSKGKACWQYVETGLYLSAFGAMGMNHARCSASFFKNSGAGSRLAFTDRHVRAALTNPISDRDWEPVRKSVWDFVQFRNMLAHFEVFHLTDVDRAQANPPTVYNVILSSNHMYAAERDHERITALSIEAIDANSERLRELAYEVFYFVIDHFPAQAFIGKGLPPFAVRHLELFRVSPRPSEFLGF